MSVDTSKIQAGWRTLGKYPNYAIHFSGEIRRIMPASSGPNRGVYWKRVSQTDSTKGYKNVSLNIGGRHVCRKVHRLVAEAFVGGRTASRNFVNHKDGDKANNNVTNLEWCTPSENGLHARKTGLHPLMLDEHAVKEIRENRLGMSRRQAAICYGVSKSTISMIANERTYTHV